MDSAQRGWRTSARAATTLTRPPPATHTMLLLYGPGADGTSVHSTSTSAYGGSSPSATEKTISAGAGAPSTAGLRSSSAHVAAIALWLRMSRYVSPATCR